MKTYRKPLMKRTRDSALISHVLRNYISTLDVMHRLFFENLSVDMCRKTVKRLAKEGWLNQFPLWDNRSFYRLGPKAISVFGYPKKRTSKPGPQRLPYEIGCLAYTCMDIVVKKRLLPSELDERCPGFPEALMHPWAYTWEEGSLVTIRVEPRCGNPRRVVEKLSAQLYRYREHQTIEELHRDNRIRFAVVVASADQETVLEQANADLGYPIELDTCHYPELVRFI